MKRRHVYQFLLISAILCAWFFMAGVEQIQQSWGGGDCIVNFPDTELDEEIRQVIGKPTGDIMCSDVWGLTGFSHCGCEHQDCDSEICLRDPLDPDYNPILDISGIQHCANLSTLELPYNEILDISPLAGLSNLTHLELDINDVVNINPLAGLTNLSVLELVDNDIVNIGPLASLTNLTVLKLDSNLITNISALSGLSNLSQLDLSDNLIVDIYPLVQNAGLTFPDTVDLEGNPSLSTLSCNVYVPQLEARGVTVNVIGSCP